MSQERPLAIRRYISIPISGSKSTRKEFFNKFLKYRGEDSFLIDYKGYHGASGSLVISKPSYLAMQNGRLAVSESKEFIFLGIYSGEPFIRGEIKDTDDQIVQEKIKVDIGQVWYFYTIQQAIDSPTWKQVDMIPIHLATPIGDTCR